jgi:tRNA(Leu) C34 or U34 (ribose-2'-O)-methylase TrmL
MPFDIRNYFCRGFASSVKTNRRATCLKSDRRSRAPVAFFCLQKTVSGQENAFYLFGPEDASLQQQVIDAADHVVFVPTEGCLNLAASVNVVLYDRMAKSKAHSSAVHNDALIKRSRDNRNRLKCR